VSTVRIVPTTKPISTIEDTPARDQREYLVPIRMNSRIRGATAGNPVDRSIVKSTTQRIRLIPKFALACPGRASA
jgi:hypothetical protein